MQIKYENTFFNNIQLVIVLTKSAHALMSVISVEVLQWESCWYGEWIFFEKANASYVLKLIYISCTKKLNNLNTTVYCYIVLINTECFYHWSKLLSGFVFDLSQQFTY